MTEYDRCDMCQAEVLYAPVRYKEWNLCSIECRDALLELQEADAAIDEERQR